MLKFGVVIFDQVMEQNTLQRNFFTQTSWNKRKGVDQSHVQNTLQKGDLLILPTQEVLSIVL